MHLHLLYTVSCLYKHLTWEILGNIQFQCSVFFLFSTTEINIFLILDVAINIWAPKFGSGAFLNLEKAELEKFNFDFEELFPLWALAVGGLTDVQEHFVIFICDVRCQLACLQRERRRFFEVYMLTWGLMMCHCFDYCCTPYFLCPSLTSCFL